MFLSKQQLSMSTLDKAESEGESPKSVFQKVFYLIGIQSRSHGIDLFVVETAVNILTLLLLLIGVPVTEGFKVLENVQSSISEEMSQFLVGAFLQFVYIVFDRYLQFVCKQLTARFHSERLFHS